MKKNIRHGVFETNSSSTHSISIGNSGQLLDTLPINDEGNVIIQPGEFGWEQETYNDAYTKAQYLAVYCRDWSGDKKDEFFTNLKDVILKQTKANDVIFDLFKDEKEERYFYPGCYDTGYIDHQSVESQDYHHVLEDKNNIRNFIFDKSSWLETDNDNH